MWLFFSDIENNLGKKKANKNHAILLSRCYEYGLCFKEIKENFFKADASQRKLSMKELMLLNSGVGEDSPESLGLQGDPSSSS